MQKMTGHIFETILTDSTEKVVQMTGMPIPLTVYANPVAGDTVTVSYSLDNGTTYKVWPNGAVTASSSDVLTSGITHLKFQRTAGSETTSTCGVC